MEEKKGVLLLTEMKEQVSILKKVDISLVCSNCVIFDVYKQLYINMYKTPRPLTIH